tara:strand:+ start:746 stop:922 length:177 start_codon:yes stop_codon:yes gene_type:complete
MKGVKHYKRNGSLHTGSSHKMADGTLHSGKTHSKNSVPLFHAKDFKQPVRSNKSKYDK